ncbi:hypothetical protein IM660_12655 [Ruania alkalisoli]|uniref:FtsX-like permease family protein n=1 Tax=Ruania alkalisoli TaxID=2779775 RepID=A0A7M1SPQ4_9MICO|nr:hypothetical protein [Ruania alkalisoli]QOR69528.1 hypothetical protein IM660_12655 [Ruania alkalisoli]
MSMLVTLTVAGTLTYLTIASTAAVRQVMEQASPEAAGVTLQTRLADDATGQDELLHETVTGLLPAAVVYRSVSTPELDVQDAGSGTAVVLATDQHAREGGELTAGAWPATPGEGVLHADAARAAGLEVGDTFAVGAQALPIRITGLWQPDDPAAARWAGDVLTAEGLDPVRPHTVGPVFLPSLDLVDVTPLVRWVITPAPDLEPADLDGWQSGLAELREVVDETEVPVRGLIVEGSLAQTVTDTANGLIAVRTAAAVPLVIVGAVSLVALWQLAGLLGLLRAPESRLLLTRGASRRQLRTAALIESAGVTGLGAAIGTGVTLALAGDRGDDATAVVLLVAAGVCLVVTAVLVTVQLSALTIHDDAAVVSGRRRPVLAGSAVILLIGAATFSMWRFARNGSALVPGTSRVDPLAVSAPALMLLAAALLALALAAPLTRGWARWASRRPGYSPVSEARQVARHLPVLAAPVVLVILASAVATMAAAYSGTSETLRTVSAGVASGADVRVRLADSSGDETVGVSRYADLDGVTQASGVLTTAVRQEDSPGTLTALPVAQSSVIAAPEALVNPVEIAESLAPHPDTLAGPEVAGIVEGNLTVSTTTTGPDMSMFAYPSARQVWLELVLWNGTEAVTVRSERVSDTPDDGATSTGSVGIEVPDGAWQVVALDVQLAAQFAQTRYEVEVAELRSGDVDLGAALSSWDPATLPLAGEGSMLAADARPLTLTAEVGLLYSGDFVRPGTVTVRAMPPPPSGTGDGLPVLVTPGWSQAILPSGADVTIAGTQLRLRAAGEIAVLPGSVSHPRGVLADLAGLQEALLRGGGSAQPVSEVWLAAGAPAEVKAPAAALAGPRAEVTTADTARGTDPVAAPARIVFWLAAAGALLLMVPAVAAVATAQATARRGEVVVLRAVGVGSAQQAASRRRELLAAQLSAIAAGAVAGLGTAALMMPDLVRATTPQVTAALPLPVRLDMAGGAILLAVITSVVVAVSFWYGHRVRAQVLDTTWREEVR